MPGNLLPSQEKAAVLHLPALQNSPLLTASTVAQHDIVSVGTFNFPKYVPEHDGATFQ
jgi:hypothetical protein